MNSDTLYLKGEEEFGPLSSFFYGIGTLFLRKHYNTIVADLLKRDFSKLLDVGCGPGKVVSRLANAKPEARFYCTDPSGSMIKIANKNFERNGLSERVKARIGSSRAVPFEEKFDAIISSFSYHHWNDRETSLEYLSTLLTSGGFLAVYEWDNDNGSRNSHGVSESEWENLEISGFQKKVEHKKHLIVLILSS